MSAGDYFLIQFEPKAPLNAADPLEQDAPRLTIGEVDLEVEIGLMLAMRDKAYDAIPSYETYLTTSGRSPQTLKSSLVNY